MTFTGALLVAAVAGSAGAADTAEGAPTAVGSSTRSFSMARHLTLRLPATAAGDVLVAALTIRAGANARITRPDGWTPLRRDSCRAPNGMALTQALFIRVATAAEHRTVTWRLAAKTGAVGGILAYRGVDARQPVEDVSGAARRNVARILAPSVMVRVPPTLVVGFFGHSGMRPDAVPAGWAVRFDVSARRSAWPASAKAGDVLRLAKGRSGNRTAGVAGRTACSIGQLVALRPAKLGVATAPAAAPTATAAPATSTASAAATASSATATATRGQRRPRRPDVDVRPAPSTSPSSR